jgi:ornithine cyclodeaminase/alanine dehydrogenase-like protein (mu-crystallin family)
MELAIQRKIPKITNINRSLERAQGLKDKLDRGDSVQVAALANTAAVASALQEADVVAATTNTTTPLWKEHVQLKEGCLVTGIGSYTPGMQEIPEYVVNDSHIVIDTPEAMSVGDLQHLGSYNSTKHPVVRAGDAFENPKGIGSSTRYIFYKAVGTAIQDVLTAEAVVKSAKEKGIGREYDMS